MSDNIYRFESQPEDEEPVDSEVDEVDEDGFTHIGYYVRRVNGDLVLVQTFITDSDDPDLANARTVYFAPDDLEPEWAIAIEEQGEALLEGKSAEFIPPDDYDDLDEDEEDEEDYDDYWDEDEEIE
ncbi:MAG: hypothetical protein KF716_14030 [Anaerolineae bacterium]|nr:hypothetical protein [Anaerolineae bacterium]